MEEGSVKSHGEFLELVGVEELSACEGFVEKMFGEGLCYCFGGGRGSVEKAAGELHGAWRASPTDSMLQICVG